MTKSATDIMDEILFAAVIDAIQALKAASKGMPNTLLRDLNAIHANVTRADLPADVQAAIQTNVRAAFTRLLKEGYTVAPRSAAEPPRGAPMRDGPRPDRRPYSAPPGGRRDGPGRPDRRDPGTGRGPRSGGGPRPGGDGGPRPGGGGGPKPVNRGGRPPKKS
jgi:hypothetical protein